MHTAMIGLGRMGMNMASRLLRAGHALAAYNRTSAKAEELARDEGAAVAYSLQEAVSLLQAPRLIWLMLPAGEVVDEHLQRLLPELEQGDVVVDGGNTHYPEDRRRAETAAEYGVGYLDVGTSGGIWGLESGYCLMAGGERWCFQRAEPVLATLAPTGGYMHCGPTGAGHFVKMVHNAIEYGMMQAYAEGFELIQASQYADAVDYSALSGLWNRGSVIRSWLLELAEHAFAQDPQLDSIKGYVEDSGEGRWSVQQAVDSGVSAPVITLSLMQRFRSRQEDTFADRVLAALRREFGGHVVSPSDRSEG
ncbi:MAG: decarboxylating 6-phosphogluconate dehydrogenase [Desulfohalobiaceae bacterium]|nr:decarboxylating 6-phosphogluconate dehydrogenase [Desulfohalobiaceae bacterium]